MKKLFVVLLTFALAKTYAADERNVVSADLKSATVYKTGAELTHTVQAHLKQGNNELVINDIANNIDVNSIQIKVANAVTLMGVEFNNNYLVPVTKSARTKMLEDSIEVLQRSWDKLNVALANNDELYEVLKTNRDIKGTQTGLSVAELMKLMDYYKIKMQELQEVKNGLNEKMKKIDEQKIKLQNQLNEEASKNKSTAGRLVLQLNVAIAGKYDFTISYIANNAYWTPYYDVRVDDIKSPIKLVTKARIAQTTGIDWKQVKLSLSTSTPNQYGAAPILNAWYLAYINPVYAMQRQLAYASNSIQPMGEKLMIRGRSSGVMTDADGYLDRKDLDYKKQYNDPLYIVNGNEMSKSDFSKIPQSSIQKIDILKDAQATSLYGNRAAAGAIIVTLKDGLDDYISIAENTLNLSYDIDLPYDVPTNGKQQTATIASTEINAGYKHYAVPKLDKDAYLLAEIADWGKLNLLPGEANIIFEGTYVGKSFIDPSSTNDTLNLTLGRDKRVVIKRDKLIDYSSVKFLGSNKLQKFTYQLTVKNTKKEAINLLLKDQFPLTTNKEIEVELVDDGGAEVNTDLGILNWKLNLGAGETKKIKFTYTVKYPKDKQLNLN